MSGEPRVVAYIDNNVFGHMAKRQGGVTAAMVADLRRLIAEGRVLVPLSMITVEEACGTFLRSPEVARDETRLILELASWDHCVKMPRQLKREVITSYADDAALPTPYLDLSRRQREQLSRWLAGEIDETRIVEKVVRPMRAEKDAFGATMLDAKAEISPSMQAHSDSGASMPTADHWFDALELDHARLLANSEGLLAACEARPLGLRGLLGEPRLRSVIAYQAALIHSHNVLNRTPRRSEAADQQHVLMAAACGGYLVTHDGRLGELLESVHSQPLKAIRLEQLLARTA